MANSVNVANRIHILNRRAAAVKTAASASVVQLHNTNRAGTVVMAEDGDTIFLPPGLHAVPGKFTWNHPAGVSHPRQTIVVSSTPAAAPAATSATTSATAPATAVATASASEPSSSEGK